MRIGKLKRVPLPEPWRHEAADFTTWLENNLDVINDVLGVSLSNSQRDKPAGTFSIDLVADDDQGNPVVIENELGESNNDQLGRVITNLATLEAKIAIWIVADPRPEHIKAIIWLNKSRSVSFYLLKVEALQIGNSPLAPHLSLVAGPRVDGSIADMKDYEIAAMRERRTKFWTQFLKYAKRVANIHEDVSHSTDNMIEEDINGLYFVYRITKLNSSIELYINRGNEYAGYNKAMCDELHRSRPEIEAAFGEPLEWVSIKDASSCRIKMELTENYDLPEDEWHNVFDRIVKKMIRFEYAFTPYIDALKL